jgi:hypothetical protein
VGVERVEKLMTEVGKLNADSIGWYCIEEKIVRAAGIKRV